MKIYQERENTKHLSPTPNVHPQGNNHVLSRQQLRGFIPKATRHMSWNGQNGSVPTQVSKLQIHELLRQQS